MNYEGSPEEEDMTNERGLLSKCCLL